VQKRDRNRTGAARAQTFNEPGELRLVQRLDLFAARAQASGDAVAVVAVDERREPRAHERVQLRSVLPADLDDVLEAAVGDERDPRAAPFEQRVGRHRGAVHEREALARRHNAGEPVEDGLRGICGSRWELEPLETAFGEQHQVGERPPGVHGHEWR
jgi:hypothetical protein